MGRVFRLRVEDDNCFVISPIDDPRIKQSLSKFSENRTELPTSHSINQYGVNALFKVKILAVFGL